MLGEQCRLLRMSSCQHSNLQPEEVLPNDALLLADDRGDGIITYFNFVLVCF